jgi:hypothetical protein
MKKRFMDMAFRGTAYAGPHELTLELLEEAVRLTHPDRHPPERAEQATRGDGRVAGAQAVCAVEATTATTE